MPTHLRHRYTRTSETAVLSGLCIIAQMMYCSSMGYNLYIQHIYFTQQIVWFDKIYCISVFVSFSILKTR